MKSPLKVKSTGFRKLARDVKSRLSLSAPIQPVLCTSGMVVVPSPVMPLPQLCRPLVMMCSVNIILMMPVTKCAHWGSPCCCDTARCVGSRSLSRKTAIRAIILSHWLKKSMRLKELVTWVSKRTKRSKSWGS